MYAFAKSSFWETSLNYFTLWKKNTVRDNLPLTHIRPMPPKTPESLN